jgi:hypothetical protein
MFIHTIFSQYSKSGKLLSKTTTRYTYLRLEVISEVRLEMLELKGSSVAAWLSETVLRGRGPGASGFESHRRGRIFSKEGNSAGPWMCVYV